MRYSSKLKYIIQYIMNSNCSMQEKRDLLCCIHINSTDTKICSNLFQCEEKYIIETLKEENFYEYKICGDCQNVKKYTDFHHSKGQTGDVCGHCKECDLKRRNNYKYNNYEDHLEHRREVYWRDPEKQYLLHKKARNKDTFKKWIKEWTKEYKKDPKHRLDNYFRSRLYNTLKILKYNDEIHLKSLSDIFKFKFEELVIHLESKFNTYMSWDNYGTYWVVDHIVPVISFEYDSINNPLFHLCWSLQNLQPLEKTLNQKKHDIISEEWNNLELAKKFGII